MEPVGKIGQTATEGISMSELIGILSAMPQDAKVWIDCDGEYFYKATKCVTRELLIGPYGEHCHEDVWRGIAESTGVVIAIIE